MHRAEHTARLIKQLLKAHERSPLSSRYVRKYDDLYKSDFQSEFDET